MSLGVNGNSGPSLQQARTWQRIKRSHFSFYPIKNKLRKKKRTRKQKQTEIQQHFGENKREPLVTGSFKIKVESPRQVC